MVFRSHSRQKRGEGRRTGRTLARSYNCCGKTGSVTWRMLWPAPTSTHEQSKHNAMTAGSRHRWRHRLERPEYKPACVSGIYLATESDLGDMCVCGGGGMLLGVQVRGSS
ncbi:unnamed protein product [Ectocarpus sp. 13 AM-2016]